ncbi:MAG TPA: hypothetical protein VEQ59_23050 [Polyangiaceae bacterium]|nr:hypothetical protein [Polyangiaceae bacterium]
MNLERPLVSAKRRQLFGAGVVLLAAVVGSVVAVRASAAGIPTPNSLTYTGYLETPQGEPLNDQVSVAIKLWDDLANGNVACEMAGTTLKPVSGRFQLQLSDDCTSAVSANANLFLEPLVNGVSLGRSKLGAVPYAVEAAHASAADSAGKDSALADELSQLQSDVAALKARLDAPISSALSADKVRYDLKETESTWITGTAPATLAPGRYWVYNILRTYKGPSSTSEFAGASLSVCTRVGSTLNVASSEVITEPDSGFSLPTAVIDYVDISEKTDKVELGLCAKQLSETQSPTVLANMRTIVMPLLK